MAAEKTYTVLYDYRDPSGKNWKAGQPYTGSEQEINAALASGAVVEETPEQAKAKAKAEQDARRA